MKPNDLLSTGETARLLHMSQQTVCRLIDTGELQGFRLPLSKVRRVTFGAVQALAARHGIPLEEPAENDAKQSHDGPDLAGRVAERQPRNGLAGAGGMDLVPESEFYRASGNTGR